MVKQSATQTCVCGQAIGFPEGQIKTVCKTKGCGAVWELGAEGFWSITPISAAQQAQQLGDAMQKFIESMKRAFERVCKFINEIAEDVDPKWLHYCKYSKKQRVRKKYERRIVSYIASCLANTPASSGSKPGLKRRTRWQGN